MVYTGMLAQKSEKKKWFVDKLDLKCVLTKTTTST